MKKIIATFSLLLISITALPVFAVSEKSTDFKELVNNVFIGGLLKPIIPLLIGLGVVVFIYGVLVTMLSEGGEKKEEGKQFMIWGIIGIFVMVSVWGLVNIVGGLFNLDTTAPTIKMDVPKVEVRVP